MCHIGYLCMCSCVVCYSVMPKFCVVLFFFFKQKTAYEMRISDWSSDVCSSDLAEQLAVDRIALLRAVERQRRHAFGVDAQYQIGGRFRVHHNFSGSASACPIVRTKREASAPLMTR